MSVSFYMALGLAGGCGAIMRYSIGRFLSQTQWFGLPVATASVNLVGCFLMGYLVVLFAQRWALSTAVQTVILTGFLGGFTTFSALSLETLNLVENATIFKAFVYAVAQLIACVIVCFLGMWLARQ